MDDLTAKQLDVIHAHAAAEFANDVDATMVTVCDDPRYELVSLGLGLETKDAVREFYARTLPPGHERKMTGEMRVEVAGPDVMISEYYVDLTLDGEQRRTRVISVIVMEGDLFKGERVYADPLFSELWAKDLGEDFADYPGVVRL